MICNLFFMMLILCSVELIGSQQVPAPAVGLKAALKAAGESEATIEAFMRTYHGQNNDQIVDEAQALVETMRGTYKGPVKSFEEDLARSKAKDLAKAKKEKRRPRRVCCCNLGTLLKLVVISAAFQQQPVLLNPRVNSHYDSDADESDAELDDRKDA